MEDVFTYAVFFQVFREMFNVTTYSVVGKGNLECSSTWYNYNQLEWIEEKASFDRIYERWKCDVASSKRINNNINGQELVFSVSFY